MCVCVHIKGGEQDAKKIIFTASHSGKLKLAFTSPDVISTSPKSFLTSRIDFTVLPLFKFRKKNITCWSGKLKTEFTSPIAKSTSPGISDTTFFARWGGLGGGESWSQAFLAETVETWDKIILQHDLPHCSKDSDLLRNGLVHKINSIAWKRWLLWNKWILQWLEKRRIFMSQTSAKLQWWGYM